MKLEISLFRFDYKSDYLPYYTKNFIKVKNEKTLLDILNNINAEHPFGFENKENFCVVVNKVHTRVSITIEELVKEFGKELIIEPISIRRAHTDLLINEADFHERLKILSEFIDEEDKAKYEEYKIYFYASNTINYEYDYIGDPILLLASNLIAKKPANEQEILNEIKEHECGAEFHTSLEKRVYNLESTIEARIAEIKAKLELPKPIKEQEFNLEKKKETLNFGNFESIKEIKHDFNEFNIAYFEGIKKDSQVIELLEKLNAKLIKTPSLNFDLALDTFHINSDFSMKLASIVMLEAFDNGADFLLVHNDNLFELFDSNRKSLSKIAGREIILPVIHKNELAKLAIGSHDTVKETLTKHAIDPEII